VILLVGTALYNAVIKHASFKSSLVDVTQPLVSSVNQFIDGIIVHDTVGRDRRRDLQESSLTEKVVGKRLRTCT